MDQPGAHRATRRRRTHRQSHRDRSSPDRPHPALESRHLHRCLRAHSRTLRHASRIARTRLQTRPFQLQRERWPLRSLPGRRPAPHRNEFPPRRLRHLRSLPRQALQRRNARRPLQRSLDFRRARHAHRAKRSSCSKIFRRFSKSSPRSSTSASATFNSASPPPRFPAAKPSASSWRANFPNAKPAAPFTFSTSPPPVSTSTTCRKLLDVLNRLVSLGNTVLIIEHHLDVIKQADWIIDLGPEGGEGGGRIVAQGTPEQVARTKKSYTGQALARVLPANGHHSNGHPPTTK